MPNYLSKVQLDKLYEIKDAFAREELGKLGTVATHDIATAISDVDGKIADAATVKAYVDAQVGSIHKFDVKIYTELPVASKDTMFILGLVAEAGVVDGSYIEYITVENPSGTYTWEKIGTTQTDLADYVKKTLTIAGIDLADNITADELKTALGLKALAFKDSAKGTVAGQTISGVKATGNSAGSIDVVLTQTPTAATVATKTQAITGGVTGTVVANGSVGIAKSDAGTQISGSVSAPTVTVTPATASIKQVSSVGTLPTKAADTWNAGTLPSFTQGAKAQWSASVDDNETLSFSFTANGDDTFSKGTLPNYVEGTFTQGTLPTLAAAGTTVVTGITKAEASAPVFTGDKFAATFTGSSADISATFAGDSIKVVDTVTYNKAAVDADATKFNPAAIELAVGDITVAAKDVTVQ